MGTVVIYPIPEPAVHTNPMCTAEPKVASCRQDREDHHSTEELREEVDPHLTVMAVGSHHGLLQEMEEGVIPREAAEVFHQEAAVECHQVCHREEEDMEDLLMGH